MSNRLYSSPSALGLFIAFLFSFQFGFSQKSIAESCVPSVWANGEFTVWINDLPNSDKKKNYVFDANGGSFVRYDDGTMRITGTIVNKKDKSWKWKVNAWFKKERNWDEWSALGRDYKAQQASAPTADKYHEDWLFWELDEARSYFAALPGGPFSGDTLYLKHRPRNLKYGFQMGKGANDKNGAFGFSGWFDYSFKKGSKWKFAGNGDFNMNLDCEKSSCKLDQINVVAECIDDQFFRLKVNIKGDGDQYVISDNQGTSPKKQLDAGTYSFGKYPKGTQVTLKVENPNVSDCQKTKTITGPDCGPPPPVCSLDSLSAVAVCNPDGTFSIQVSFSGDGSGYVLSDDQSTAPLSNISAGSYSFGNYASDTEVILTLTDTEVNNCSLSSQVITQSCAPPPPTCSLEALNVVAQCNPDGTFDIEVSFSGAGTGYILSDNQGSTALSNLAEGSYSFGNYASGTEVILTLTDTEVDSCSLSSQPITQSCAPPPPSCSLDSLSAVAVCNTDGSFSIEVSFSGAGAGYVLSDDQGTTILSGLAAGSYSFGNYASDTEVILTLTDTEVDSCTQSSQPITQSCAPPPPSCSLDSLSAVAVCNTDGSFSIQVSFSGEGSGFVLSDDQGTPAFSGIAAGSYTFGKYPSTTQVVLSLSDTETDSCSLSTLPITQDCAPPPPICSLDSFTAVAVCNPDGTFSLQVSFIGEGNVYSLVDDQGNPALGPLPAGSYTYGTYNSGTEVVLTLSDNGNDSCSLVSPVLTQDCSTPVCTLDSLQASTVCNPDGSFSILLSFTGEGNGFILSDNQNTAVLTGISAGSYTFGNYPNGTSVVIALFDPSKPGCSLLRNVSRSDCPPPPTCDVDSLDLSTECISPDEFIIRVRFTGSGDQYNISDNVGVSQITGVAAGIYELGPYPSNSSITVGIFDLRINDCRLLSAPISADCTPPPPTNDLCTDAAPLACGELISATTRSASDVGVCGYCETFPEGPGVWYLLEGEGDSVALEVCGNFDTRLIVYQLGCDTLACVTGNDDSATPGCSEVNFLANAGELYWIYVNGGAGGDFELNATCTVPPPVSFGPESRDDYMYVVQSTFFTGQFYPNPANEKVYYQVVLRESQQVHWILSSPSGTVLDQGSDFLLKGMQMMEISLPVVPKGSYLLQFFAAGKRISSHKLNIQAE